MLSRNTSGRRAASPLHHEKERLLPPRPAWVGVSASGDFYGPEPKQALEAECEVTDLDPHKKGSRALNRLLHDHRLSFGTRIWMALLTILGAALFSWLLMSPLHLAGIPQFEKTSNEHIFTPSHQASSGYVQMIMVHHFIYLIDREGLVSALWTRHKYVYVLWQHAVAPSSRLVRVDHNVVYLAYPDGSRVALRATDGAVRWMRR